MARKDELIVGLDIGTTKVCALVGERTPDGIEIIGFGSAPSEGMRKGVVIDIDNTVESIVQAIDEAEHMAGCEITKVYAGIAGGHVQGTNSRGAVVVKGEVTHHDMQKVHEVAKAVVLPADREVLHVFPQEYIVDKQDGIKNPLGMNAQRLEAKVHVVTGAITSEQNIIKCAHRAGLSVEGVVLQPLASSKATLYSDERELGVALVDIGGGTTDIVIFHNGAIVHTSVITLGGDHVTNDIATGLRTPVQEAEEIKKKYGCALTSLVGAEERVDVPSLGDRKARQLPRQMLAEIIEPRMDEIFQLVQQEIEKSGYYQLLSSGVVVTGGATLLAGTCELAEEAMNLPVRRGVPRGVGGLSDVVGSPIFATGVGLVLYGSEYREPDHARGGSGKGLYSKTVERMRAFFKEMF